MNLDIDYAHALHGASLYVEELKYAEGPRRLEAVTPESLAEQLGLLFRDANLRELDPAEVVKDSYFYGLSFELTLGINRQLTHSIFIDGLLHGLALGAGLRAEPPE